MKTPEEILINNCPVFSSLFHDKSNKASVIMKESILKSMEEYAVQSVECAVDSSEKIKEDLRDEYEQQFSGLKFELAKCQSILESEKSRLEILANSFRELSKSHVKQANELRCQDRTIDRLENEMTEGVEIMSSIYHNVDKYHLSISFKNGELFDKLKDYLGV